MIQTPEPCPWCGQLLKDPLTEVCPKCGSKLRWDGKLHAYVVVSFKQTKLEECNR